MVYFTGDTHQFEIMRRLNTSNFPIQKEMTKEDYVIVAGDFGIWNRNSKEEKYIMDWLEEKPFTTLFISGNHENYDILNALSIEEWHGGKVNYIRPSVIHLRRGEIFDINGLSVFALGGASSHDIQDGILDPNDYDDYDEFRRVWKSWDKQNKMFRINHISWWKDELPNEVELEYARQNLQKHNNKVDIILTHSPSNSELILMGGKGLYEFDSLTYFLEDIKAEVDYKYHIFGHMHLDRQLNEKDICLYNTFLRLE